MTQKRKDKKNSDSGYASNKTGPAWSCAMTFLGSAADPIMNSASRPEKRTYEQLSAQDEFQLQPQSPLGI